MTTAGDLAALLGGARVTKASATLRSFDDPAATLQAWSVAGPWQAEAKAGDPAVFGLPPKPVTIESRQWVDRVRGRMGEERGGVKIEEDPALTLSLWTAPQPLTRALELSFTGPAEVLGRDALRVDASARGDAFAGVLTPLGWGAERWELLVDATHGVLLGTTAFAPGGAVFRRVEAVELSLG
jgi:hypothetical protein